MNAAAVPRFTCNLANPAAAFADMEAHLALRCSPAVYATKLEAALVGLGTDRRPSQDQLLARTRAFQDSGATDPAAFDHLVNSVFLDETVALFERAEARGVRWHGYPAVRLWEPLHTDTFDSGPTVDLHADPATAQGAWSETDWCAEAAGTVAQWEAALGAVKWDFLRSTLLNITHNSVYGDASMRTFYKSGPDVRIRIGALHYLENYLQRNQAARTPHHVYGEFALLDGVIAHVLGRCLIGTGIGVFSAHDRTVLSTSLTLHDLDHARAGSFNDRILREMQLFVICCTAPSLMESRGYYLLEYAEGASGGSTYYSAWPNPSAPPSKEAAEEMRAGIALWKDILLDPGRYRPDWILDDKSCTAMHNKIAEAEATLAALA